MQSNQGAECSLGVWTKPKRPNPGGPRGRIGYSSWRRLFAYTAVIWLLCQINEDIRLSPVVTVTIPN